MTQAAYRLGSRRSMRRGAATALGAILLLSACSSSSSKGSNGGSGGATTTTLSPDAVLGTPKQATGTPVTVGLISASQSDNPLSAQFKQVEQGYNVAVK